MYNSFVRMRLTAVCTHKYFLEMSGDVYKRQLVLHGGTGIPDDMIKKAISLGVAKINVNTECQLSCQD